MQGERELRTATAAGAARARLEFLGGPWDGRTDELPHDGTRLPDRVMPDLDATAETTGFYDLVRLADGVGFYEWRIRRAAVAGR